MNASDYLLIGFGALIAVVLFIILNQRRKINEQVRRVKLANEPGYKPPRNDMDATIKDGVITYRKRRRK